jgi:uncharacterized protein with HEPN domain
MRPDRLYLSDIIEAADDIAEFVTGLDASSFEVDKRTRRAVLQALIQIGEAAGHVSPELKDKYPVVPWRQAVAFRNFVVHVYFATRWRTVWTTATEDIPPLRQQIAAILAAEFPEGS